MAETNPINQVSHKVDDIQKQLTQIAKDSAEMQKQVNKLYIAFTGNDLGQTGIVARVKTLEDDYQSLNKLKIKMIGVGIGAATAWSLILDFIKHKFGL